MDEGKHRAKPNGGAGRARSRSGPDAGRSTRRAAGTDAGSDSGSAARAGRDARAADTGASREPAAAAPAAAARARSVQHPAVRRARALGARARPCSTLRRRRRTPHRRAPRTPQHGPPAPAARPAARPRPPPLPRAAAAGHRDAPAAAAPAARAPPAQPPRPRTDGTAPARRRWPPALVAVLALVAGGVGGGVGAYLERNGGDIADVELPQAAADEAGTRAPDSVAGIAAQALPSVVTLHVSGGGEEGTGTGFVLDDAGPHPHQQPRRRARPAPTARSPVTFNGGETAEAEVVGRDSGYDLAVVKVSGVSGLKPLPLGNSDNVAGRRPGRRHRRPLRPGRHRHLRHHQRQGPAHHRGRRAAATAATSLRRRPADRRPDQPGQLRRPAARRQGPGHRHQLRHPVRRQRRRPRTAARPADRPRLRHPVNQAKRVAEELINTGKATHPVIGVTLDMEYTGDGARVGTKGQDGGPAVTAGRPRRPGRASSRATSSPRSTASGCTPARS